MHRVSHACASFMSRRTAVHRFRATRRLAKCVTGPSCGMLCAATPRPNSRAQPQGSSPLTDTITGRRGLTASAAGDLTKAGSSRPRAAWELPQGEDREVGPHPPRNVAGSWSCRGSRRPRRSHPGHRHFRCFPRGWWMAYGHTSATYLVASCRDSPGRLAGRSRCRPLYRREAAGGSRPHGRPPGRCSVA